MRYILFAGAEYYARGGFYDIITQSDSLQDLEDHPMTSEDYSDWWHIMDTQTELIVMESDGQAF